MRNKKGQAAQTLTWVPALVVISMMIIFLFFSFLIKTPEVQKIEGKEINFKTAKSMAALCRTDPDFIDRENIFKFSGSEMQEDFFGIAGADFLTSKVKGGENG